MARLRGAGGAALAATAVILLSFADGGYEQRAWHAAALFFVCAAAIGVVLRGWPEAARGQWLTLGAGLALAAWTALSQLWSAAPGLASPEAQRTLVYVAAVAAAIAVGGALLPGVVLGVGVVCGYSLGERIVHGAPDPPDLFGGTLLHEPIGYANGLGGLAAIGLAGAVALALRGGRRGLPWLAPAALALVTLVLTESRGGWLAAGAGTAVALALGMDRVRLARAVVLGAGVLLATGLALSAGPLADDLAERGGDRPLYWHVAWEAVAEAPVAGLGAGMFELAWIERGHPSISVRDAHSLYLETLAELGLVGLALLVAFLAPPLVTALRARPAAAAATGAYVAFLVHAGLDWDWELPAVTVAGLLCGAAVYAQDRAATDVSTEVPAEGASG